MADDPGSGTNVGTQTYVSAQIMNKSLTDSVPVRQADCRADKLYYSLQDKV
jgi:hypothetical protein